VTLVQVTDLDNRKPRGEFTDVSQVEKFEITEEEYDKKEGGKWYGSSSTSCRLTTGFPFPTGTVRDFKRRHKLGRFAPDADKSMPGPDEYAAEAEQISVGKRCEVAPPGAGEGSEEGMMMKRGVVKYVGQVAELKPGWWVGVEYDEPVGKHDGRWVVWGLDRPQNGVTHSKSFITHSSGESRYFTARNKHGAFVRPNRVSVGDYPEEDLDLLMDEDDEI
jgi:tubulin-folding cofactor B